MEQDPLPLRRIIDDAFVHLRRHFSKIYVPVAIPISLLSAVPTLFQGFAMRSVFGQVGSRPSPAFIMGMVSTLGGAILVGFLQFLGGLIFVVAAVTAVRTGSVDMGQASRRALAPRMIGTGFLSGLIVLAGMLCCLLPGIYAALVLCVTIQVATEEGVFGRAALKRSQFLTTYNPRGTLGSDPRVKAFVVLLVGWLVATAISFLVTIPAIVVQELILFRNIASGARINPAQTLPFLMWIQVPVVVVNALARQGVLLYEAFAYSLLFFDLRERREGKDLERAIDDLARPGPEGGSASS